MMEKTAYKNLIQNNTHILPDEIDLENRFDSSYGKVMRAKEIIEEDTCKKSKEISNTITKYKKAALDILGASIDGEEKSAQIDILLEKTLTELNETGVFSSTCDAPYHVPFLKAGHLITYCPGDRARDQLVKHFIAKIGECWRGKSANGKPLTVIVEHSDGQCIRHNTMILDIDMLYTPLSETTASLN
ncbi:MAG: hypothetical protein ACK4NC_07030 [Candidatus Gracilibacteria bacterium]